MRRTKNKFSRFRKHRKHSKNNKSLKTKRRKYQKNRRTRKAGNPLTSGLRTLATETARHLRPVAKVAATTARAAAEKPKVRDAASQLGKDLGLEVAKYKFNEIRRPKI